jgi:hypothetical protein
MITFLAVALFTGSDLFDLPWYSRLCFPIFMGSLFLGVEMIVVSLWGLWLGKP